MESTYKIFATSNAQELGKQIADQLGKELGKSYATKFSDGEVYMRYEESIRGNAVVLIGQADMPYENLFELLISIDAARRASAKEIICVLPYLPHSRQERKDNTRSSISARLIADFIQNSGADRVIMLDLHTTAIEGFFYRPVDHLDMRQLFLEHIGRHFSSSELCLCSPDFGGVKRVKLFKQQLECSMAVIQKERLLPNQVDNMEIIGEVNGKDVVIVDDMVDTAGTLCKAAQLIMENGAKSVTAYCTHGILSGNAIERINNSVLSKLIITDTIVQNVESDKIEVIGCAGVIAKALENLMNNKSIKALNEV